MLPLESVPNVSEGRDPAVIEAVGAALAEHADVLDVHSDADHNRSVFTIVGDDDAIVEALAAGIACARERIDLRRHEGVHPRVGAADVVPVVPLRPEDMDRAKAAAHEVARRVGESGLPVFLYGETGDGRGPAFYRRGGPEELQRRVDVGEVAPAYGPARLDPAAGGVIVGARRPLIAFNVDLANRDVESAKAIARVIRERDGGLPGVRALGLDLPAAGHAQISMNIEDWETTPPHVVVAAIEREAKARGVELAAAELVGLLPAGALVAAGRRSLRLDGLDASRVLELRLLQ